MSSSADLHLWWHVRKLPVGKLLRRWISAAVEFGIWLREYLLCPRVCLATTSVWQRTSYSIITASSAMWKWSYKIKHCQFSGIIFFRLSYISLPSAWVLITFSVTCSFHQNWPLMEHAIWSLPVPWPWWRPKWGVCHAEESWGYHHNLWWRLFSVLVLPLLTGVSISHLPPLPFFANSTAAPFLSVSLVFQPQLYIYLFYFSCLFIFFFIYYLTIFIVILLLLLLLLVFRYYCIILMKCLHVFRSVDVTR